MDLAATNLTLPVDVITEIRNSAAAGMEITAHEQPVNFYGSSQVGYIILDPVTGAGAYKIGGGENGADIILAGGGEEPSYLEKALDMVSLISEELLSGFGDRFTQEFLKIKGDIDRIKTAIDLINNSDELGSAAGITSI